MARMRAVEHAAYKARVLQEEQEAEMEMAQEQDGQQPARWVWCILSVPNAINYKSMRVGVVA
jgi:uncharacterized protein YmfQ (DUF2313 family)